MPGWRAQWVRSRPVTVQPSASDQRSRWVAVSGMGGACTVGTVMPSPPGAAPRRPRVVAGEVEEHLVERRAAQGDVLDRDAGRVQLAAAAVSAATRSPTGALTRRASGSTSGWSPDTRPTMAAVAAGWSARAATTSIRSPPSLDFSSSGDPSAITRPWSITETWSASWSASSRYWVVSSTVVPSATSARTAAQTSLRPRGSRPVVGSSRNSTGGARIRLAARSRRRRMPPEYCLTGLAPVSARPNRSSSSSARRRRRPRPGGGAGRT